MPCPEDPQGWGPAGSWLLPAPQQGTQGGEDALTCRAREAGQPAQPGIPLRNVLTLEPGAEP